MLAGGRFGGQRHSRRTHHLGTSDGVLWAEAAKLGTATVVDRPIGEALALVEVTDSADSAIVVLRAVGDTVRAGETATPDRATVAALVTSGVGVGVGVMLVSCPWRRR